MNSPLGRNLNHQYANHVHFATLRVVSYFKFGLKVAFESYIVWFECEVRLRIIKFTCEQGSTSYVSRHINFIASSIWHRVEYCRSIFNEML